ncbi:hypothetical protein VNO80_15575 [Phaseolus coccineus]|uniref:DUF4283 domain-containing protein n=1 Tax=Phaseolus coccineus TaxID=3886 RepID=A0AAN9MLV5_PHACN
MLEAGKVQTVKEIFIMEGFNFIRVRYLEEKYVLLSSESKGDVKKTLDENNEWFGTVFELVEPWNNGFAMEEKLVWMRCRGIPLRFWSRQCFEKIRGLVGSLVEVDEATIGKEVLEYTRLHFRVLVDGEAKMIKYVCVNGIQSRVVMEEETSHMNFLHVIPQKWGECSEVESEVGIEEKGGAELYDFEWSDYGDEEIGARVGEKLSVQCPGKEKRQAGDACSASRGFSRNGAGFIEMDGGKVCARKEDDDRVSKEVVAASHYLRGFESATAKRIERRDGLIFDGLLKAQTKAHASRIMRVLEDGEQGSCKRGRREGDASEARGEEEEEKASERGNDNSDSTHVHDGNNIAHDGNNVTHESTAINESQDGEDSAIIGPDKVLTAKVRGTTEIASKQHNPKFIMLE